MWGNDRGSCKGILYVKIRKEINNKKQNVHVFVSHLNAENYGAAEALLAQRKQLEVWHNWIQSLTQNEENEHCNDSDCPIHPGEPVILAGDLNRDHRVSDPYGHFDLLGVEPVYGTANRHAHAGSASIEARVTSERGEADLTTGTAGFNPLLNQYTYHNIEAKEVDKMSQTRLGDGKCEPNSAESNCRSNITLGNDWVRQFGSAGSKSKGRSKMLDYVMMSRAHKQPAWATAQTLRIQAKDGNELKKFDGKNGKPGISAFDVSDHFGILSRFEF